MAFNGIKFDTSVPGMVPWEIVTIYFIVGLAVVFYFARRFGLKSFTTIDLVYIAVGAAFSVVWEFYIGSFIGRFLPSTPFIGVGFWGRMFILLIVAALVRKPGTGILSLLIFNILSDLFFYGFGGEPMYTIYEALTYGLFLDLVIVASRGKLFGIGYKSSNGSSVSIKTVAGLAILEGIIIGILFAIPDPIFYLGFFRPLISGAIVNWATIQFDFLAFIPGHVVIGILGTLAGQRIAKAVGQ